MDTNGKMIGVPAYPKDSACSRFAVGIPNIRLRQQLYVYQFHVFLRYKVGQCVSIVCLIWNRKLCYRVVIFGKILDRNSFHFANCYTTRKTCQYAFHIEVKSFEKHLRVNDKRCHILQIIQSQFHKDSSRWSWHSALRSSFTLEIKSCLDASSHEGSDVHFLIFSKPTRKISHGGSRFSKYAELGHLQRCGYEMNEDLCTCIANVLLNNRCFSRWCSRCRYRRGIICV